MNLTNAARLFQSAAEKGSVAGQYDLAYLYEQGTGVAQSEINAAKWYELAAEGGDSTAQYDIGQRYELGIGVKTNLVSAFKWLSLASAQGQSDASKMIDDLKSKMTDADIAQAKQLVSSFVPRTAVAAK
jgi:TPR repeat protein